MASSGAPKSRVSKQQVLKNLAILDSIPNGYISPSLPPSPPPSRDPSPSLKRKHEAASDLSNKRARVAGASQTPPSPPNSPPGVSTDFSPTPVVPAKRPPNLDDVNHYNIQAKMLKRSSDARYHRASSMPEGDSRDGEHRLYLVESLDAYINFVYHFWLLEIIESRKDHTKAWRSLSPMLDIIKRRIETILRIPVRNPAAGNFRERASALSAMLERLQGFIYSNVSRRSLSSATTVLEGHLNERRASTSPHGQGTPGHHASPPNQQPTPPTLPSPVSALTPPSTTSSAVSIPELDDLKQALEDARQAQVSLMTAAESPLLRPDGLQRLFPHTHRRIDLSRHAKGVCEELGLTLDQAAAIKDTMPVQLALTVLEWPTTPSPGLGASIGAVCNAMRAMVWELGRDCGYAGRATTNS